jgi:integrase
MLADPELRVIVRSLRIARQRAHQPSALAEQNGGMPKRSYGTGQLYVVKGSRGRETWYGRWRAGERKINRRIGGKRATGTRMGLTRAQAERKLQRLIDQEPGSPIEQRVGIDDAGMMLIDHLDSLGRKRSTIDEYRSYLRVHLGPFFGDTALDKITPSRVEGFVATKRREGKATKSILNYLGLLHSIFAFAERRGLASANPVASIDKPVRSAATADIRFLDATEVDALLAAVPDDPRGPTERAIYLTGAMTGLRQGELLALRWQDIDWSAGRIRVRRSFVRGEFGTPKSRRSTRSVPLADEVAGQLERHFQRSQYQHDDDLVFGHPHTGDPLDRSRLLKRFKAAAKRAGLQSVRFHDLRHTFGTRMAAVGVPLRTLQEWMGHRDFKTTLIYADYQPNEHEAELVQRAFASRPFGHRPASSVQPPS